MEFINGEDIRQFYVEVAYEKNEDVDLFRVSLLDKGLNQEQILLRNADGVYVLTPALNQVYEFKGLYSVGIGFIAHLIIISSPVVMPPSIPPSLLVPLLIP